MAQVKKMVYDSDILKTFSLLKQLRPHLLEDDYLVTIKRLHNTHGYNLVAVIDNGEVKSAAGYRITESLAWGAYLYVDDLITDGNSRSNGYAKRLFDWLESEAKKNNWLLGSTDRRPGIELWCMAF